MSTVQCSGCSKTTTEDQLREGLCGLCVSWAWVTAYFTDERIWSAGMVWTKKHMGRAIRFGKSWRMRARLDAAFVAEPALRRHCPDGRTLGVPRFLWSSLIPTTLLGCCWSPRCGAVQAQDHHRCSRPQ